MVLGISISIKIRDSLDFLVGLRRSSIGGLPGPKRSRIGTYIRSTGYSFWISWTVDHFFTGGTFPKQQAPLSRFTSRIAGGAQRLITGYWDNLHTMHVVLHCYSVLVYCLKQRTLKKLAIFILEWKWLTPSWFTGYRYGRRQSLCVLVQRDTATRTRRVFSN